MVNQPTPPAHHPIPLNSKKCTYTGEVCDTHGEGALWRYKPKIVMIRGKRTRKGKDWFLVCDVNRDNKKLLQPKISSMISSRPNNTLEEGGGVSGDKNNQDNQSSTATEGQGHDWQTWLELTLMWVTWPGLCEDRINCLIQHNTENIYLWFSIVLTFTTLSTILLYHLTSFWD